MWPAMEALSCVGLDNKHVKHAPAETLVFYKLD